MHMRKMHSAGDAFAAQPTWVRLAIGVLALMISAGAIFVPYGVASQARVVGSDVRSRYNVGALATDDLRASETFHYIDEAETKRRQRLAADAVLPRFLFSTIETALMFQALESCSGKDPLPPMIRCGLRSPAWKNSSAHRCARWCMS
jgi:hypothetical protein